MIILFSSWGLGSHYNTQKLWIRTAGRQLSSTVLQCSGKIDPEEITIHDIISTKLSEEESLTDAKVGVIFSTCFCYPILTASQGKLTPPRQDT